MEAYILVMACKKISLEIWWIKAMIKLMFIWSEITATYQRQLHNDSHYMATIGMVRMAQQIDQV